MRGAIPPLRQLCLYIYRPDEVNFKKRTRVISDNVPRTLFQFQMQRNSEHTADHKSLLLRQQQRGHLVLAKSDISLYSN
jgi:hypothetical protein